jgi:hypothetical protein
MNVFRTLALICCASCIVLSSVQAQVMDSTNYSIQFDSVNVGGGRSTSSSYGLEDTTGEVATGDSASTNYAVKAGYQQMNQSSIAIAVVSSTGLTNVSGISGGSSQGQTTWNVITDNPAGYTMSIKASTTPALRSSAGASVADYTPVSSSTPDYTFTIATTDSEFGFSPEGVDTYQRFKDNGSVCNVGSLNTSDTCWDGLSTTVKTIAERTTSNHSIGGSTTSVKFRAEIGADKIQDSGVYSANITVTAVTL